MAVLLNFFDNLYLSKLQALVITSCWFPRKRNFLIVIHLIMHLVADKKGSALGNKAWCCIVRWAGDVKKFCSG